MTHLCSRWVLIFIAIAIVAWWNATPENDFDDDLSYREKTRNFEDLWGNCSDKCGHPPARLSLIQCICKVKPNYPYGIDEQRY